jgi:hypothetical protein
VWLKQMCLAVMWRRWGIVSDDLDVLFKRRLLYTHCSYFAEHQNARSPWYFML